MTEGEIVIVSVNARGTNEIRKLVGIENLIKKYKPDFLFIQETNINSIYRARQQINRLGLKNGIYNLGNHFNGTAILQTSNRWKIVDQTTDNTGRKVELKINNGSHSYTLINIYTPQDRKRERFL